MHRTLAIAASAALAMVAGAACATSTARLVYGGAWNQAGLAVKNTMSSPAFKSASKGRYVPEFVEETGDRPAEKNLGSMKLPCIFLISEAGNCYFVWDNVPARFTAQQIVRYLDKAEAVRADAEKKGFATADDCGEFLSRMERYVGGPRRIVSRGFYPEVFEKLKSLDPNDETGWQRHFTLGVDLDKSAKADGLELVEKANKFRENGDFAGGAAFVEAEMKKPRRHMSKEQLQGILMAKFALFRDKPEMKDELDRILEKIAAFDESTFWGTAALGWLNARGRPPLSAYWGWHGTDFSGRGFSKELRYGVRDGFSRAGDYEVVFENRGGSPVKFTEIVLMAGESAAMKPLGSPRVEGGRYSFDLSLPASLRKKVTSIVVKGDAAKDAESTGSITIHRKILRPRGKAR